MSLKSTSRASIDRASPEPYYLQLSRLIEDAIDRGEYAAGERLPAESEFCRRYKLARSTVRETLRTLEDRKRIRVIPRRGAFVVDADQSGWVLQVAAGFFEGEADHNQRKVDTTVLEAKLKAFPAAPASALQLKKSEKGFVLRRLRRLDGRLALCSVNYLLPELEKVLRGSAVMKPDGSLSRVLERAGYRIFGARRSVEAVPAPPDVAKLLEVPAGAPLLLVTSVSWKKDGRVFDYYTSWVRTDVVKITIEANAAGASAG